MVSIAVKPLVVQIHSKMKVLTIMNLVSKFRLIKAFLSQKILKKAYNKIEKPLYKRYKMMILAN